MSRTPFNDATPGDRVSIDATLISVRTAADGLINLYTLSIGEDDGVKLVMPSDKGPLTSEFRTGEVVTLSDAVVARVGGQENETLDSEPAAVAELVATVFTSHRQRELVENLIRRSGTVLIESGETAIKPLWYPDH